MDQTTLSETSSAPDPRGVASLDEGRAPHVLYLAHDLDDPAVWRRTRMLERGGARVTVAGFRRQDGPLPDGTVTLGRTRDARMLQRAGAVARASLGLGRALGPLPGPDAVVARNLEMLALASRLPGRARLVYEVLDVHRMMLGDGLRTRVLRGVERRLARRASLLLTSSPGFVRHYFAPHGVMADRVRLVENKVLPVAEPLPPPPLPAGGPVAIGWFGNLRCRWSLHALDALTRAEPGRYRVDLHGRPALDAVPDFHAVVEANPDLRFGGPYRNPEDLPRIYGAISIIWMVDRFDAGSNSDWLLPNRLYEGGSQGRIPLALEGTEVAAELRRKGIGLVLPRPEPGEVARLLGPLDAAALEVLAAAVRRVPATAWFTSPEECRDVLRDVLGAEGGEAR